MLLLAASLVCALAAELGSFAPAPVPSSAGPAERPRKIDLDAEAVDLLAADRSPPVTGICNAHEHVLNRKQLPKLLSAMERTGVVRTAILGSPRYTYYLGTAGFTEYDENNEEVLEMARMHPERLVPFVAIRPDDSDAVEKLVRYLDDGAVGVKLYAGHGGKDGRRVPFHTMPLDDARLEAIYRIIEERKVPLLFHVNYAKFPDELERVLASHPAMKVLCPHFCLTLSYHSQLRSLLERHPNLWTDVSFGWVQFQAEGYDRISGKPNAVRELIADFPDRFLFGTDLVITGHPRKSADWITINVNAYRDMLERERYPFYALGGLPLRGLHLEPPLLRRVYRQNCDEWLYAPPKPVSPPASGPSR
jgi:predicted TIM-barrel fold metal-dependent hydrolase